MPEKPHLLNLCLSPSTRLAANLPQTVKQTLHAAAPTSRRAVCSMASRLIALAHAYPHAHAPSARLLGPARPCVSALSLRPSLTVTVSSNICGPASATQLCPVVCSPYRHASSSSRATPLRGSKANDPAPRSGSGPPDQQQQLQQRTADSASASDFSRFVPEAYSDLQARLLAADAGRNAKLIATGFFSMPRA